MYIVVMAAVVLVIVGVLALVLGRYTLKVKVEAPPGFDDWRDQVIWQSQHGNKIAAIKLYRDRSKQGLKESKEFVDALERAVGPLGPIDSAGTDPARIQAFRDTIDQLIKASGSGAGFNATIATSTSPAGTWTVRITNGQVEFDGAVPAELLNQIAAGRMVDAIAWTRKHTGLSLGDAKLVVDALAARPPE